jgi:hypothetical protein
MEAKRFDAEKPQYHLFHPAYLLDLIPSLATAPMFRWFWLREPLKPQFNVNATAAVLKFGAAKYDALNYAHGMSYSRVFNSWLRHASVIFYQENRDEESGLLHRYHADANVYFAHVYHILGYDNGPFDDRPATIPGGLPVTLTTKPEVVK